MMATTHLESEINPMPQHYKTIVIDPPWPGPGSVHRFDVNQTKRSVSVIPYSTMTVVNIAALRIRDIAAPDSCLWIWATSRSIGDAMLLMELWGFTYRGLFIWMKRLGMGRHMRHQVEMLLWAGRPGARLVDPRKCPRQVHEWPRPRRHSEKPAEAYAMIAELCDGPRIDIFARQARPGFEAWGNEAPIAEMTGG